MTNRKPLILITNDDGFFTKGIKALADAAIELGEVVIVAPDGPRSGMSSSLTSINPLRFHLDEERENYKLYICSGTPVDCIKLAMNRIVDRKPDLILAGVNHGANSAISVIYSGTMGAAIEGCLYGIPSVGFSLCNYSLEADFTETNKIIKIVAEKVLKEGIQEGTCLNVNIPDGKVKGIKAGRQCKGKWVKEIMGSKDGGKSDVYWLSGYFESSEANAKNTDEAILKQSYASVVPVKVDMTDYDYLDKLNDWELEF